MITLRFDGLYRNLGEDNSPHLHAGVMCYGWLIWRNGVLIARGHGGFIRREDATSNIAEYLALIEGLGALQDMGFQHQPLEIIGDARSVIDQMTGAAAVNSAKTRPLYRRAQRMAQKFTHLTWGWNPRSQNHAADQLTRRAMRQINANPGKYHAAISKIEDLSLPKNQRKHLFPLLDLRVYQPLGLSA